MIRRVVIRGFKRFADVTLDMSGHAVLAGPNGTGKTTVLQAISAWSLALERWRQLRDYRRSPSYKKAPLTRQAFYAVPLRSFDLLWRNRAYRGAIEIQVLSSDGREITMELIANSTEQIYVRPKSDVPREVLETASLRTVLVPAMSGLVTEEPVYRPPMLDLLLGQARPGEMLRNLLLEASLEEQSGAWEKLRRSIQDLFGYELLPPSATGAHILAEYKIQAGGFRLDIASAGSGFQQALMLLTVLYTRPGSVLLLDEPDAYLHIILREAILAELKAVAASQGSQLIIATHSEAIINSAEPGELCAMRNQ
jgi:predicted ATPase